MNELELRKYQPKHHDVKAIVDWLEHNCSICTKKPNCSMFKNYEYKTMFGLPYTNTEHLSIMFDNKCCAEFIFNPNKDTSPNQFRV